MGRAAGVGDWAGSKGNTTDQETELWAEGLLEGGTNKLAHGNNGD